MILQPSKRIAFLYKHTVDRSKAKRHGRSHHSSYHNESEQRHSYTKFLRPLMTVVKKPGEHVFDEIQETLFMDLQSNTTTTSASDGLY